MSADHQVIFLSLNHLICDAGQKSGGFLKYQNCADGCRVESPQEAVWQWHIIGKSTRTDSCRKSVS